MRGRVAAESTCVDAGDAGVLCTGRDAEPVPPSEGPAPRAPRRIFKEKKGAQVFSSGLFRGAAYGAWILAASFVGHAHAEGFTAPEGCTVMAAVHKSECVVSNIMRCENGLQVLSFEDGVPISVHLYGDDWGLRGFEQAGDLPARFEALETDVALSLPQLIATGQAAEAGTFKLNTNVIRDRTYLMKGAVTLSQNEVSVGGVPFRTGRIERLFELKPGQGGMEIGIDIYVSEELGLMLEGRMSRSVMGQASPNIEHVPQRVAVGGPGATHSDFGCN